MKRMIRLSSFILVGLSFQANVWSADQLAGIIERFSNEDTAAQYDARRELAAYVARSTAPDKPGGAEKITRELIGYLDDRNLNYEARKYIVRDLARVGTETAVGPLGKIMVGKDKLLAEDARQALEQIEGSEATGVFRKAIAGEKNDSMRRTYIRSLANRRDPGVQDYFIKGLSSKDSVLAQESVYALTKLGGEASDAALEKAYLGKSSPEMRSELERALVALPSTRDSTLLKIAGSGASSANKQAALGRLVESGHAESDQLLGSAITSSDAHLRATAIRLALENGKASLVQNQAKSFTSDDWLIILGELKAFDPGVAESLAMQALEHSDTTVQADGLRALGTYGSAKSIDPILEHFSGRDKELQMAATYAIERIPGNPMNNRINKLLRSESEEDLALGIQLLAYREMPNAKGRLFKFINGENLNLAREALKTLSTTADEEDLYKLLFLARRSEDPLKSTITGMLKKVVSEIGSLELKAKVAAL